MNVVCRNCMGSVWKEHAYSKPEYTFPVVSFLYPVQTTSKSRDSSVGIALGYGLDYRGFKVRILEGAGNFSLHHRVQNGSGAHPASYPMDTEGSFLGGKVAVA
jgi:hypothetical protein